MPEHFPRVRAHFTLTFKTLSPLHIGHGGTVELAAANEDNTSQAASLLVGSNNEPIIPGTTLKGLLRRVGEAAFSNASKESEASIERLFGVIKDTDKNEGKAVNPRLDQPEKPKSSGQQGAISVFSAKLTQFAEAGEAPLAGNTGKGEGVFVLARTRIDGATGTADDHKLFHAEMVAAGAEFTADIVMDLRAQPSAPNNGEDNRSDAAAKPRCALASAQDIAADFKTVLAALAGSDAWSLGKYQADGFGEIRLETVSAKFSRLGKSGSFEDFTPEGFAPTDLSIEALRAAGKAEASGERLSFTCRGPFLVLDASKSRKRGKDRDPENKDPHIVAQSWRDDAAMLVGTSLSGVLRARAAWLEGVDDPKEAIVRNGDISALTPLDLLMGATGFRALMTVRNLVLEGGRQEDITSVKLDRFTGGPVDNALFKTRAFTGTRLSFTLVLDEARLRSPKIAAKAEDVRDLFKRLVADVGDDILMLGHGTNKGFGWFQPMSKGA